PLSARPDRAAETELERRQHWFQRSSFLIEDETDAHDCQPHAARFHAPRGFLPIDAQASKEIVALRRVLIEFLVAARAVESDGGRIDEDLGSPGLRVRLPCQSAYHVLGAFDSAGVKKFLESGVPSLAENVLPGEVYGGVAIAERVLPRSGLHRVAGLDGDAVAELLTCGFGSAGQHYDRVAALRQSPKQAGTDQSPSSPYRYPPLPI